MTMRIKVKNEDTNRLARVLVREHVQADPSRLPSVSEVRTLRPGEEAEFWVHAARDLVVEEVA